MLTHLSIVVGLSIALVILVNRGLLQVDLSFPWLIGILILGLASINPAFVTVTAGVLGILYPPIAVVFIVIFLLLGIVVVLSVAITRLRLRQIRIVRRLSALELERQEARLDMTQL